MKKESDEKVLKGDLDRLGVEQGDGLKKISREVTKERNEKKRTAAAERKFARSSKEAMSRKSCRLPCDSPNQYWREPGYDTTEADVKDDHEDTEVIRSIRRGSSIIFALEESFQHSSRNRPRRSNSYDSPFIQREDEEEESKSLKRGRGEVSRSDKTG